MGIRRRLQYVLSCLLAVLLVGGTILPSPAVWQCHHSARIVNAAFLASPSAMPCRMSGIQMPKMACCPAEKLAACPHSRNERIISRPRCQPTLTRLAVIPIVSASKLQAHLAQSQASFPLWPALLSSVPISPQVRQRAPPTLGLPQSLLAHTPGLRAPPLA
jgi:hypothetical protein